MRPWTLVVLSNFGRDRIAWQSYDMLFDQICPLAIFRCQIDTCCECRPSLHFWIGWQRSSVGCPAYPTEASGATSPLHQTNSAARTESMLDVGSLPQHKSLKTFWSGKIGLKIYAGICRRLATDTRRRRHINVGSASIFNECSTSDVAATVDDGLATS